jgi:excisionase family DNA binding protein
MEQLAFDIDEAAEMLHVKRTWLRDKVTAQAVPFTRVGRHVRFTRDHLLAILAQNEVAPVVANPRGAR